jgi:anti-sigma regulatory factor (Ser/Thr protein kinase)
MQEANGMHNVLIGQVGARVRGSAHRHDVAAPLPHTGFRHESFFHAGEHEFLERTVPFIAEGLASGEPVLVAVSTRRTALLEEALGALAPAVGFADVQKLGRNPARMIPAWKRFLDERAGTAPGARGVDESIWAGRSEEELGECLRHEALLNLAFGDSRPWHLLCAYDTDALEDRVIEAARRTHPIVEERGVSAASDLYEPVADPFGGTLPAPPRDAMRMAFTILELASVREAVFDAAASAGLPRARSEDLVLAVNELATNSVTHGGGGGLLRLWQQEQTLLGEVSDRGHITAPMAGRLRPAPRQLSGRGLWLVNQVCDLTQIRSSPRGTVVRVSIRVGCAETHGDPA